MARKKISHSDVSERVGLRLSSHEKVCAERMKTLFNAIEELKVEVKSLRTDVAKGKGAISVLVFFGTIIAGIVGFFSWDG